MIGIRYLRDDILIHGGGIEPSGGVKKLAPPWSESVICEGDIHGGGIQPPGGVELHRKLSGDGEVGGDILDPDSYFWRVMFSCVGDKAVSTGASKQRITVTSDLLLVRF